MADGLLNEADDALKPCFTTSNAIILTNLHNAARDQAAGVLGVKTGGALNQFIVNSGITDDGKTVADNDNQIEVRNRFVNENLEVGVVQTVKMMKAGLTDDPGKVERVNKTNEGRIATARRKALRCIRMYMKWFCGNPIFSDDDLVEYGPSYNGGRQTVSGGVIDSDREFKTRRDEFVQGSLEDGGKFRIGFKVGYTINFK